ncbi:hypothetical protein ACFW7O_44255, partial [Streptomyces diastatochromogenes]
VQGDAAAYARALAEVRAAGPGPRTAPEAARHYCISRSAARLMDVYTAALGPVVRLPPAALRADAASLTTGPARTVPQPRSSEGVTSP